MIGDDLVNSYHLLLCCLDLVFANALLCSNKKELINPSFKGGFPPNWSINISKAAMRELYRLPLKPRPSGDVLRVGNPFIYVACVCVGLPAGCHAEGQAALSKPPCVLERLCELHDGLVVEAKGIKQHYFKPYIQKLFEKQVPSPSSACTVTFELCKLLPVTSASKQILKGKAEHLTELLDAQNFLDNK